MMAQGETLSHLMAIRIPLSFRLLCTVWRQLYCTVSNDNVAPLEKLYHIVKTKNQYSPPQCPIA